MKISLRWLNDHVDLAGIPAEEIATRLTMRSCLIEGIEHLGKGLEQVVVGHVLARERHPDADRLSVCQVDAGGGALTVVCGAPNVAAGQKIAFAPVGATLPHGLNLDARKIRGVHSHGMICSESELGLSEGHEGILVLDPAARVGQRLVEHLEIDDHVFDIDNKSVTHRGDLWGHRGFARELAALFGRPLKPCPMRDVAYGDAGDFPIRLEAPDGCPLYLGLLIDDVPAKAPSPRWMQRRLSAVGMRPIHLLVDLSNYVMLELGQPTHPFDRDALSGGQIVVRRARDGERLKTLDGTERKFVPADLVIADQRDAVALAGIMGGAATEISDGTRHVLLESAVFDSISLRRSSARQSLRSEALARFEKFLDPLLAEQAVQRFAVLLEKLCPSARIGKCVRTGNAVPQWRKITLRPARARMKLGYALSTEEMMRHLKSIEFEVRAAGAAKLDETTPALEVTVPTFRAGRDIQHEDDLIEEVGRLAGYDRVPASLPRLPCAPPPADPLRVLGRDVVRTLVHECAYTETTNYSFTTDRDVELFEAAGLDYVRLRNPVTADSARLRRSLVPGLLGFLARNSLRRDDLRLFEIGRTYQPEAAGMDASRVPEDRGMPIERRMLCAVRASRGLPAEPLLLAVRADVERLFARLRLEANGQRTVATPHFAHPAQCIEWRSGDRLLGHAATLHPRLARSFELGPSVVVIDLDLDQVAARPRPAVRMKAIPELPPVYRDLAIEVREQVEVAEVVRLITESGHPQLHSVELFDVYRGDKIAAGHRSLCLHLEYRTDGRTLTDQEVDTIHQRIVKRLAAEGMRLRE